MPSFSIVDHAMFHPTPGVDLTPEAIGVPGEEVFLDTEDGVRIHGFVLPAEAPRLGLLFLHGNAGNASHRLPNAALFREMGATVLLLDYRGYGRSQGRPSEHGVYADARAGLAHLSALGFPEERVVLFGRSLGGAVAVDLAKGRRLAGVILESTFTSVTDMVRGMFGFGGGPLTRGKFVSVEKIAEVRAPLLFLHGDRDEIVPYALGRKLFEAAPEPKAFETIRGAGHNDTVERGGGPYRARIRAFLESAARGESGGMMRPRPEE